MMLYDYSVKNAKGEDVSLNAYAGKVVVIVNTATGCGFTPHYEPLQAMYEKYHDQGLEILDIPCNQFGNQAPGTDEEIHQFCSLKYHTSFPQMKKSEVNGDNQLPLYRFLKEEQPFKGFPTGCPGSDFMDDMLRKADPEYDKKPNIMWNFTKFIADRKGNIVARFEPTAPMEQVEAVVVSLLNGADLAKRDALEVMETRRSSRKYTDQRVPKDVIEKIVRAGTYAATGMGRQAPIMIVVENEALRDRLSAMNAAVMGGSMDPFYGAKQVIVVLADRNVATYVYDGSLVMGNLMNAAEALGVSSCWIHRAKEVFDSEEGKQILKDLGIEGDYEGIGNLIIGYDDGGKRPAAPRKSNYVYWAE